MKSLYSSFLLLAAVGMPSSAEITTYTVGGDGTLTTSVFATATPQLSPVYSSSKSTSVKQPRGKAIGDIRAGAIVPAFETKTVYGFLDFTTTVGSTVMVFTPQSQTAKNKENPKTHSDPPASRSLRYTKSSSAFTLRPTPSLELALLTPTPTASPKFTISASSTLESSFFNPQTALAIETLFSVEPTTNNPGEGSVSEEKEVKHKNKAPLKPFRRAPYAKRPQSSSSGTRNGVPPIFFGSDRRKPPRHSFKASTIVPITVEGTGTLSKTPSVTSTPTLTTPAEVVVKATQGFRSISVIGPFSTAVENNIGETSEYYDFLSSEPLHVEEESYDIYNAEPTPTFSDYESDLYSTTSEFPTGLVTRIGGTLVSKGLTTVHETEVIGTFIEGQYAQILQSTSHIFKNPDMETLQSVIKGSATQFIDTDATSALPLESLFSSAAVFGNDYDDGSLQSVISKRTGVNDLQGARIERSRSVYDPFVDAEEDYDLQRSGSNLRPSFNFRPSASLRRTPEVSTFYADAVSPTTFRRRFTPTNRFAKPVPTRRFGVESPTTFRPSDSRSDSRQKQSRPLNRWRLNSSPRPKVQIGRRPSFNNNKNNNRNQEIDEYQEYQEIDQGPLDPVQKPTPPPAITNKNEVETLGFVTSTPADGATDVYYELVTIRSLHTFRVGTTKNTRYVTFTRTSTHYIDTTPAPSITNDELYENYENPPLFENILDSPRDISTLPPIDIGEGDITALLETVTETFSTTEIMMKTSVLPVLYGGDTSYYTLTQTYHIARVVTALKTVPPVEAFSFIPENSLTEFNDQLLAEGSENEESLLPGEREYDENGDIIDTRSEVRVPPPPGFPFQDPNLEDLVSGSFNPDAFEQQTNPAFVAALQHQKEMSLHKSQQPQLISGQQELPTTSNNAQPTPNLSPEQLQQLAYLRLINPYFGGFPQMQQQPQSTVVSSPVTITTDVVTTSTRVLRVIFNARPIYTTLSTVETIHTTITTFETSTVTVTPQVPSFPFPFGGNGFPANGFPANGFPSNGFPGAFQG
ncbi:unnamed protein product [Meganyctiphanes norvegica]|uniref:DUF4758 domain-containing protein n=1 Tax=Meganyctiphanes norvegica TaxID=48144 RepID=A0AAV2RCF1_MEGNR